MTASRRLAFLPGVLAGLTLAVAMATPGAHAYHTNFQGSCTNEWFPTSGVTRGQARIYAEIGAHEGYQWGGGCWNDNNRDDARGDPTEDASTRGEGGDCSGFTFKSWFERSGPHDWGLHLPLPHAERPRAVHSRRVQARSWHPELDAVQIGRDRNGRLGIREPHRHDLSAQHGLQH